MKKLQKKYSTLTKNQTIRYTKFLDRITWQSALDIRHIPAIIRHRLEIYQRDISKQQKHELKNEILNLFTDYKTAHKWAFDVYPEIEDSLLRDNHSLEIIEDLYNRMIELKFEVKPHSKFWMFFTPTLSYKTDYGRSKRSR